MTHDQIRIDIPPIPAPPPRSTTPIRWQTYFVWLVIFITGIVVGVTFSP
jgi:hypothetical protein